MLDATAELLKSLTEANGVPGHEGEVRRLLRGRLDKLGQVSRDALGNLLCTLQGAAERPRVMLAAHMDEVGFMVRHIDEKGFLYFLPLGGWFDQVLLGQRVVVQTRRGPVIGVIGAKPPHLVPPAERRKVVERKDMYIDVGAVSFEEVQQIGVRVGDPAVPLADFIPLANGKTYLAKAFDDRVGTALLVEALQQLKGSDHANTIVGVATVMEEVQVRGAATATRSAEPDVALVLETTIAGDVPGISARQSAVRLGGGPALFFFDKRMIPNPALRDLVLETAEELDIPVQPSLVEGGGTDGGPIHVYGTGVPTVVVAVPARHIHSHSAIIHRGDYDLALDLVVEVVKRLDAAAVERLAD